MYISEYFVRQATRWSPAEARDYAKHNGGSMYLLVMLTALRSALSERHFWEDNKAMHALLASQWEALQAIRDVADGYTEYPALPSDLELQDGANW